MEPSLFIPKDGTSPPQTAVLVDTRFVNVRLRRCTKLRPDPASINSQDEDGYL